MQYTAVSSGDGYSLSYNIGSSGSGNTRGSGMADTILNGSGNYQTRQVNHCQTLCLCKLLCDLVCLRIYLSVDL